MKIIVEILVKHDQQEKLLGTKTFMLTMPDDSDPYLYQGSISIGAPVVKKNEQLLLRLKVPGDKVFIWCLYSEEGYPSSIDLFK